MYVCFRIQWTDEFDKKEVSDCILDKDSPFFINLMRLKVCNILEFQGSYQSINDHFSKIAALLNASGSKGDKMYKSAFRLFKFSEVNGINLGFSQSGYGAGFGEKLRKQVINDAFVNFEPDAGRGPVDFKVSRGGDKTIVKIKLTCCAS